MIRKQWLLSHICYWLITIIYAYVAFVQFAIKGSRPLTTLALPLVFFGLFALTFFWIILYCAYLKRGTKWLMFWLIVIPLSVASEFFTMRTKYAMAVSYTELAGALGMHVVSLAIRVWHWICSLRYRREILASRSQEVQKMSEANL